MFGKAVRGPARDFRGGGPAELEEEAADEAEKALRLPLTHLNWKIFCIHAYERYDEHSLCRNCLCYYS